jgi:hypothetical protein
MLVWFGMVEINLTIVQMCACMHVLVMRDKRDLKMNSSFFFFFFKL